MGVSERIARIDTALDEIRPYLHSHGGNISIERLEGDTIFVKFEGACSGCPISFLTLQEGVEKKIKEVDAQIASVVVVE